MDEQPATAPPVTLAITEPWNWDAVLDGPDRGPLETALARAIATRRWFGSKTREITSLEITDAVAVSASVRLVIVAVHFTRGPSEFYQVPLVFSGQLDTGSAALIRVESGSGTPLGVISDALADLEFCRRLLELFDSPGKLAGRAGEIAVSRLDSFDRLRGDRQQALTPMPVAAEQSNTSVIYGDRLILKMFRRIEMGLNPDFEISEFLTRAGFAGTPPLAGSLVYRQDRGEPWALAMLQQFVPSRGDAWTFTLDWLTAAMTPSALEARIAPPEHHLSHAAEAPIAAEAKAAFGDFLDSIALLGRRTAEMHLALASDPANGDFAPAPFEEPDRRTFLHRAAQQAGETFEILRAHQPRLHGDVAERARRVALLEPSAIGRYQQLAAAEVRVDKIRIHGDYHLGQVLATAGDFAIIDFEGEPLRSISERRQKQLALRDVAGMVRSLHYASCTAAANNGQEGRVRAWTQAWYGWSVVAFLSAYRRTAGSASFLPESNEAFERLLDACLLEKAIYELRYELNNRPDWVYLPLAALEDLLAE